MTNSLITILMPAKNARKYIDECLSSIRRQTFSFWELIIVNDSSIDNTEEILKEFCELDPRIQLYQNKDQGIIPALQLALSYAKGEFITRMDADDLMPDNKLELMHQAITSALPKTIVTGLVQYISDKPISAGYSKYEQWLNERVEYNDHWDWVYRECIIASPNWMMRRNELLKMGGFDHLSYPEDYDLVLKWYYQEFNVLSIEETTLLWREHSERTSRNSDHYAQESFFRLKVNHFISHDPGTSQLVLWGTEVKGKLTATILNENNIPFSWMGLGDHNQPQVLLGKTILSYQEIEKMKNFKLLITVYPEGRQMDKMTSYLDRLGLIMGKHYWFL